MTAEFFLNAVTAYQNLFWPKFVVHDDCVFLAFDENIYQQWIQIAEGDKREVEQIMNHRHIVDLLPKSVEQPTLELVVSLGKLLQEVWEAKLQRDFPKRCFCVNFPLEECKNLTDYEITFYQSITPTTRSGS